MAGKSKYAFESKIHVYRATKRMTQQELADLVGVSRQTVELTPMEFDILLLLARRPGQVFSARQIYEAVATDSYDASWTGISSMVYKLRRKLGAGIIETVRGHGYKFVAPGTSPK